MVLVSINLEGVKKHSQDAPQLSEQINQMVDKAKHHWCNSRIDKCCSLRLIQRHCAQPAHCGGLCKVLNMIVRSVLSDPFSPAVQQLSLRLEPGFKPHQLLHSSRHHHGCR